MKHRLGMGLLVMASFACGQTGDPTQGLGPDAAITVNPFPCGVAQPVLNEATGFESCEAGHRRRVQPGTCTSTVPRSAPVPNYDSVLDRCQSDAECAELKHGHCAARAGGLGRECVEGCLADSECSDGQICECAEPVGRCVPASCRSSADCEPGFDCASYETAPGCFSTGYSCQSAADECTGDGSPECDGRFVNATFCVYGANQRQCSTTQCNAP